MIRPRNVDINKRLLVVSEREEMSTEMQIPRNQSIEIPKTDALPLLEITKKSFARPEFYYKHLTLPSNSLENILDYEYTQDDISVFQELENNKKVPPGLLTFQLFEKIIEVWEIDTAKGQIIPYVRAEYLIKEEKVSEKLQAPENYTASTIILQKLYDHWFKTREKLGHPLLRRFWKTESITDTQLRIAFQPRSQSWSKERMRLRNSKKNDGESYEKVKSIQMKSLYKHWESLHTIIQAVYYREQLKKFSVESKIAHFDQERNEKLGKKAEIYTPDSKITEISRELRSSARIIESSTASLPLQSPLPPSLPQCKPELPLKRVRSEVQKRNDFPFEVALNCCRLLLEAEKSKIWPFMDAKKSENSEGHKDMSKALQVQRENKLKMRGRVGRGSKRVEIDRLLINDCEHSWGRYMGLSGNWHRLDGEAQGEYFEDEDNEAFQRLHRLITTGFKRNNGIRAYS